MLQEAPNFYRQKDTERVQTVEDEIKRFGITVVVDAHPDDYGVISGGSIALAAKDNPVTIITATKGERGAEKHGWDMETTATVRHAEQLAAGTILGVPEQSQQWLGYTDGDLPYVDPEEAIESIGDRLQALHADTVISFGHDGVTGHEDHRTVHSWTTEAFKRFAKPGAKLYYMTSPRSWAYGDQRAVLDTMGFFYPGYPENRNIDTELHIVLPPELLDTKMQAVMKHHSQYNHIFPHLPQDQLRNIFRQERLIHAQTKPRENEYVLFQR